MSLTLSFPMLQFKKSDGIWSEWLSTSINIDENTDQVISIETTLENGDQEIINTPFPIIFRHIAPSDCNDVRNTFWLIIKDNNLYKCEYNPMAKQAVKGIRLAASNTKQKPATAASILPEGFAIDVDEYTQLVNMANTIYEQPIVQSSPIEKIIHPQPLSEQGSNIQDLPEIEEEIIRAPDASIKMNLLNDPLPEPDTELHQSSDNNGDYERAIALSLNTMQPANQDSPDTSALNQIASLFESADDIDNEDIAWAIKLSLNEKVQQNPPVQSEIEEHTSNISTEDLEEKEDDLETQIRELSMAYEALETSPSQISSPKPITANNIQELVLLIIQNTNDIALFMAKIKSNILAHVKNSEDLSTLTSTLSSQQQEALLNTIADELPGILDDVPTPPVNLAGSDNNDDNITPLDILEPEENADNNIKEMIENFMYTAISNTSITIPVITSIAFMIAGLAIAIGSLGLSVAASIGIGLASGALAGTASFFAVKHFSEITPEENSNSYTPV